MSTRIEFLFMVLEIRNGLYTEMAQDFNRALKNIRLNVFSPTSNIRAYSEKQYLFISTVTWKLHTKCDQFKSSHKESQVFHNCRRQVFV